ncbi:hypothetical protein [Meiothermus ruber]|uniref:Uncharacterized protein n=1 Tax=Meiothermus ruber (strain ATCC 35948 / DSM 1279 / VKM B-1258 / 21) TaxID=504728 RepID=D3PTB8_MEIRD|nr:hypothetical protein [Meiothermus ruber]ADD28701.1 hypothetical protein Mrub_1945 [Meiothermus ruber DSM 1279]AGK05853.1 hypothetical protein K649_12835 [Meiothermus ruber DSM 1279]
MPKTLNPNNNFPTSITNFPISGNNEPIAIEPLEAAIQAVLDRTENLHQSRVTLEGIGTKRIRQFASRSALSAASGFADGDIVSVDGYGLYRLFVSSSATVDGLWVLTASGGGRWIHLERDLKGANLGLATLDGSGRLAQDVRDNSIFSAHIVNGSVTSAKLASGAVVGHLGYTPLNKAGDNMTGRLSIEGHRLFNVYVDQGSDDTDRYYPLGRVTNHAGILKIQGTLGGHEPSQGRANIDLQISRRGQFRVDGYILGTAGHASILAKDGGDGWTYVWLRTGIFALVNLELSSTGGAEITYNASSSTTAPGGIQFYDLLDDYNNNTHPHTIKLKDGVLKARYDHRDRFVFSSNVGFDYTLPGGSYTFVAQFMVHIPNGKSLYLRRARYRMTNPAIRLRVIGENTFTSSNTADDVTPDALIDPNSGLRPITVAVYNSGSNNQTFYSYDSYWLEFEIA